MSLPSNQARDATDSGLVATGIFRRYAGFNALDDVNLTVAPGERRALIGPNGAGKSTLFDILGGQRPPSDGTITFGGADVTTMPAHKRALKGIARTFQRNNLFAGVTVYENIRLAVQAHSKASRNLWKASASYAEINELSDGVIERLSLKRLSERRAGDLSYGDQRKLEIAMAVAGQPKVLLVDEPTAGMSRAETTEMVAVMASLPKTMSLIIVEHDMDVVAALSDRMTVLQNGRIIDEGDWAHIRDSEIVQRAYMGTRKKAKHT
jgi:branched-chain amino acid transport system ATP-binding protein